MTDRERMLRDLDTCLWDTMRALADEAEESGDDRLARGWRWLAENGRFPEKNDGGWFWASSVMGVGDHIPVRPDAIPYHAHQYLQGRWSHSLSSALLAAAHAVGEWLAAEGRRKADEAHAEALRRQLKDCPGCQGTATVRYSTGMTEACKLCAKARRGWEAHAQKDMARAFGLEGDSHYASLYTTQAVFEPGSVLDLPPGSVLDL